MDYPEIVEAFEADLKADPFGTAMAIFREVLETVLSTGYEGAMSDYEFLTLDEMRRTVNGTTARRPE
jgi:hypothetical protein